MKKTLLVLIAIVLAVALVACTGGKDPEITDDSDTTTVVTTTAVTTTARTRFTVRFLDAEEFGATVLSEAEVNRGKSARAPLNPSHEGYIFLGWDYDDFSSITADIDIYAVYRPLDTYSVTFYGADGNPLGDAVSVVEGGKIEAPEAPRVYGKFFVGWDKELDVVDRAWSDFEQYADLSVDEIKETRLEYKVTALYEDAELIIPYKEGISMEFKEIKDANGVKIYEPVDSIFSESTAVYYSDNVFAYPSGHKGEIGCTGTFVVAWDGEWVYVYAKVFDKTLLTRGVDYVMNSLTNENPWQNDAVEVHYTFEVEPTKTTRNVVKMDAFGYRKFANPEWDYSSAPEQSKFFSEIETSFKQLQDTNTYYVIFKIPAKTEDGEKLVAGDAAYFSMQITDLRSPASSDPSTPLESIDLYCTGGWRYYYNLSNGTPTKWNRMILGMAE